MPGNVTMAPHETLELHEIMQNEVACVRKLQTNIHKIQDQQLRSFMENSLQAKRQTLNEFKSLYNRQQLQ